MRLLKNPFAIRKSDGKVITISDVPPNQHGYACGCICPVCGQTLSAKIGEVQTHHFAHKGKDCNSTLAFMTALYKALSQSLTDAPFTFPATYGVPLEIAQINPFYLEEFKTAGPLIRCSFTNTSRDYKLLLPGKKVKLDPLSFQEVDGFPTALIAKAGNKKIALIITLSGTCQETNTVLPEHTFENFDDVQAALSINVHLDFYSNTSESLQHFFLNDTTHKSWIKNSKLDKWIQENSPRV